MRARGWKKERASKRMKRESMVLTKWSVLCFVLLVGAGLYLKSVPL